jgi:GT2 family glycosyltransferase/glycosyltransferase involved in cell wall biosynthesis
VDHFHSYHTVHGAWSAAAGLLGELRGHSFDAVILPVPPGMRAPHFQLFVLFTLLVKAKCRLLIDATGETQPFLFRHLLNCLTDVPGFYLALPFARLMNRLLLAFTRTSSVKEQRSRGDDGALAFLVPVLPDISHTFVYRELLSLLAQYGRTRKIVVVALEQGSAFPLHNEAKELLAHAVFVPPVSLVTYLVHYLYFLFTRPRRMARLIDAYAEYSNGDRCLFLRVQNLYGLHPSRGISLARLLEREGVSRIHCYGTSYPATRSFVAAHLLDVPFSFSSFVDFDYDYPFKTLKEKLHDAEFAVACTNYCQKRLIEMGGESCAAKIHVVHHGVDPKTIVPRPVSKMRNPGVYTACRLVEKKGLEYLIGACSILKNRGTSLRCSIIGDGPERQRLEKLVDRHGLLDNVRFLGALPNHQIQERIGSEDICVVPAVYCSDGERDGIPVILLEALAAGHAVISTEVSGIPELIEDGVHGLLVPERDAPALAEAIERLINEPALRKQLIAAGQERVRHDFDINDKAQLLWKCLCQTDKTLPKTIAPAESTRTLSGSGKKQTVSAVFVNCNGSKFLEPLFASLRSQTYPLLEVFFFDNASTDHSIEMARSLYQDLKVIQFDHNTGYSHPVNQGIRQSAGDHVLILNVDLVLEDDFVEQLMRALERNPTAGWASGKLLKLTASGKSDQIDCLGHHMSRGRYATERDYSRPFDWNEYKQERFVFGASACAAIYRRSMLHDIQLAGEYFDEDFFAYFEDVDVDWRAQLRGWKCLYVPAAVGYHMRGGTGLIKRPEIAACYLANRWLMLVKNDVLAHFLPDLLPFASRVARDVYAYLRENPKALFFGAIRFATHFPRMWKKRKAIQKARLTPLIYVRGLIR